MLYNALIKTKLSIKVISDNEVGIVYKWVKAPSSAPLLKIPLFWKFLFPHPFFHSDILHSFPHHNPGSQNTLQPHPTHQPPLHHHIEDIYFQ